MTQAELAERAQTTQPKIALAESGDANLTLNTVMRYVEALRGRVRFAIEPEEFETPRLPVWWELTGILPQEGTTWQEHTFLVQQQNDSVLLAAGWVGNHQAKRQTMTIDLPKSVLFHADVMTELHERGEHALGGSTSEEDIS